MIRHRADQPTDLLKDAHITYHAPLRGTSTPLPDASIDIHYSTDVLEHVSREVIVGVLREGRRVLRAEGRTIHVVDARDHFAEFDSTISTINFLQYSDIQWQRYAGHYLAHHNRLRDPHFEQLFHEAGFKLLEHSFELDKRALRVLETDFKLAPEFRGIGFEELCRGELRFLGRPALLPRAKRVFDPVLGSLGDPGC